MVFQLQTNMIMVLLQSLFVMEEIKETVNWVHLLRKRQNLLKLKQLHLKKMRPKKKLQRRIQKLKQPKKMSLKRKLPRKKIQSLRQLSLKRKKLKTQEPLLQRQNRRKNPSQIVFISLKMVFPPQINKMMLQQLYLFVMEKTKVNVRQELLLKRKLNLTNLKRQFHIVIMLVTIKVVRVLLMKDWLIHTLIDQI